MKILLIAGAIAMAVGTPVLAQSKGKGAAGKAPNSQSMKQKKSKADKRTNVRAPNKHGGNDCPPGLMKKSTACVPPGQASRSFREGQRVGKGYRYYTPYGNIPEAVRSQYGLSENNRYIYRDNRIYEVSPTTSLVTRVISTIF